MGALMSISHLHMIVLCLVTLFPPLADASGDYAGSEQCRSCHRSEFSAWRQSHHTQAMSAVSDRDLTQFDGKGHQFLDRRIAFNRQADGYTITEQIADGAEYNYPVAFTLGFYPLQQYVIDTGNGRLQLFDIAWDTRPASDGGQRWFMIDIDQESHSLSWNSSLMNWNSRCASCHTTGFSRNYLSEPDAAQAITSAATQSGITATVTQRYQSRWSELAVGCESCHGPAASHIEWAQSGATDNNEKGLTHLLAPPRQWDNSGHLPQPSVKSAAQSLPAAESMTEIRAETEICFNCHARRQLLKDESNHQPFSETANLRLLEPDLYYPDGQIKDEVFVAGSFLQSKMHTAGVTCSNCHDPHSNQLTQPGNAICTQCHNPERFDSQAHHHHEDSAGSQCVSCHMPTRTYMGVDERHDHAFQKPDPLLSMQLATPNVCLQCHTEADNPDWLEHRVKRLWPQLLEGGSLRAETATLLNSLWQQTPPQNWEHKLNDLIRRHPANYTRASLVYAAPQALNAKNFEQFLTSNTALLEVAGLNAVTRQTPLSQVRQSLALLKSPALNVRISAYKALLPFQPDPAQLPAYANELLKAEAEYLEALQLNRDTPMAMVELANYHLIKGDSERSRQLLQEALAVEPGLLVAAINLADLYRAQKDDAAGIKVLQRALQHHPDNYLLHYSIGLSYARLKLAELALSHLQSAFQLSNQQPDLALTLIVALNSFQRSQEARQLLEQMLKRYPQESRFHALKATLR